MTKHEFGGVMSDGYLHEHYEVAVDDARFSAHENAIQFAAFTANRAPALAPTTFAPPTHAPPVHAQQAHTVTQSGWCYYHFRYNPVKVP